MAKLTVKTHRDGLEDHGDKWRIERRFLAEPCKKETVEIDGKMVERDIQGTSPGHFWVVYELVATGAVPEVKNDKGEVVTPRKSADHPVIVDRITGKPARTHMTHIWVPRFAGPEQEARAKLAELAK